MHGVSNSACIKRPYKNCQGLNAAATLASFLHVNIAPTSMIEPFYGPDLTPVLDDPASAAPPEPLSFGFTGSGAEYFRIWIVNLLLTVVSFGIYSAWAKTRRLQYFYRNTHLAGASFDFRGNPKAILRGRLLAVTVLAAYHYAFGFSVAFGVTVIALLLAGLPFMMRSALRFRLANTWYRGLPFGFGGGISRAYLVYLPPASLILLPGALVALWPASVAARMSFLLYLAWPLIHGAMKAYQHRHLVFGDQPAVFHLSVFRLARPYLVVGLIGFGILVAAGIALAFFFKAAKPGEMGAGVTAIVSTVVLVYLLYLLGGPLMQVKVNNLAWSATSFPGVRITCAMRARSYLGLQTVNVILTLLTLGLYRPFAAVRTWRYRGAHLRVEAPSGFEAAALAASPRRVAAAGDGVADFIGVDLSW
jgi:uncharacterized membrane protein YjgN (DUF898 family)